MTIYQIKEWRERRILNRTYNSNWKLDEGFEIIDTLLAEVERLQAQPHSVGEWHNADDVRKLTIATQALERIADNVGKFTLSYEYASDAIKQIQEVGNE